MNQENNEQKPIIPAEVAPTALAPTNVVSSEVAVPETAVAASETINIDHFMKVKLRVGQVISAEPVPKSKKLLKLQVSLGEQLGTRQILSGIAQHYSPETITGKRIIVVANLQPAKLMGLESQGMLLAGSNEDDSVLAVLEPDEKLPLGSLVR